MSRPIENKHPLGDLAYSQSVETRLPEGSVELEISVVVPVYQGEFTLRPLIEAIESLTNGAQTPAGRAFRVIEVILVDDCGPDRSDLVISSLAVEFGFVRPARMMRNYGEHAAVAAGIGLTHGQWVVTLDEDFQHDPSQIGLILDGAVETDAHLVYGSSSQSKVHPRWRRASSTASKRIIKALFGGHATTFCSYRLIEGDRAREAARSMTYRTYLDVALTWTCGRVHEVPIEPGRELRSHSGYSLGSLLSHFWMLVLSSGTRPLRFVSALGVLAVLFASVGSVFVAYGVIWGDSDVRGWASIFVLVLGSSGLVLFALGVIAEYVGAVLSVARGRPAFVLLQEDTEDHH